MCSSSVSFKAECKYWVCHDFCHIKSAELYLTFYSACCTPQNAQSPYLHFCISNKELLSVCYFPYSIWFNWKASTLIYWGEKLCEQSTGWGFGVIRFYFQVCRRLLGEFRAVWLSWCVFISADFLSVLSLVVNSCLCPKYTNIMDVVLRESS